MKKSLSGPKSLPERIVRMFTRDFGLKALSLSLALVIYGVLQPESESPSTSRIQIVREVQSERTEQPAGPAREQTEAGRPEPESKPQLPAENKPADGGPHEIEKRFAAASAAIENYGGASADEENGQAGVEALEIKTLEE